MKPSGMPIRLRLVARAARVVHQVEHSLLQALVAGVVGLRAIDLDVEDRAVGDVGFGDQILLVAQEAGDRGGELVEDRALDRLEHRLRRDQAREARGGSNRADR